MGKYKIKWNKYYEFEYIKKSSFPHLMIYINTDDIILIKQIIQPSIFIIIDRSENCQHPFFELHFKNGINDIEFILRNNLDKGKELENLSGELKKIGIPWGIM